MLDHIAEAFEIQKLRDMALRGEIDFSLSISRDYEAWDRKQKSMFIDSIINEYYIPIFKAMKDKEGNLFFLDGKQRLTGVLSFINNEYRLDINNLYENDNKIKSKYYSELSEELKRKILSKKFDFLIYENLNDDEMLNVVIRSNCAVPHTKHERMRILLGIKNMNEIKKLINHPFLVVKTTLPYNIRSREEALFQLIFMLQAGRTEYYESEIYEYVESNKGELINKEIFNEIKVVLDYMDIAFKTKSKCIKRTTIPTIYYIASIAMKNGVVSKDFANWIINLYEGDACNVYKEKSKALDSKSDLQVKKKLVEQLFYKEFNLANK